MYIYIYIIQIYVHNEIICNEQNKRFNGRVFIIEECLTFVSYYLDIVKQERLVGHEIKRREVVHCMGVQLCNLVVMS